MVVSKCVGESGYPIGLYLKFRRSCAYVQLLIIAYQCACIPVFAEPGSGSDGNDDTDRHTKTAAPV